MDVETLIRQVWSPEVRPLAEEAWRCYNAGAVRMCVAATWTAVTTDIITKLVWLADDGDTKAEPFSAELLKAQHKGLTIEGVRAMQGIEAVLLDKAAEFELIDSIGVRELTRIREDRNLCVHPSLRTHGDVYEPRSEVGRGHLAVALTTLLTHPPTQGGKLRDEFCAYICDSLFVPTSSHIQSTFYDRVRTATRATIITVAAKHALLELPDPGGRISDIELADRMAVALRAFAERDRELVRTAVAGQYDRFQKLDGEPLMRALGRVGDQDFFLSSVDDPLVGRITGLIDTLAPVTDWVPLPAETAAVVSLVRSPLARGRLPILESRFSALSWTQRLSVAAERPDEYFVPAMIDLIQEAPGWRFGEQAGRVLVQYGPFLTLETLQKVLAAWCGNSECRQASGMLDIAVSLFHGTAHLGSSQVDVFYEFLTKIRTLEGNDSPFTYPTLTQALREAGHNAS